MEGKGGGKGGWGERSRFGGVHKVDQGGWIRGPPNPGGSWVEPSHDLSLYAKTWPVLLKYADIL